MGVFSFGLSGHGNSMLSPAAGPNETKILFARQYGTYILFLDKARVRAKHPKGVVHEIRDYRRG
jgi:hypothetical protein